MTDSLCISFLAPVFSTYVPLLFLLFFFNDTATTEIYTLSLHDALPIYISTIGRRQFLNQVGAAGIALASGSRAGRVANAQTIAPSRARVMLDPGRDLVALDCRLLGSMVEHVGRGVYEGSSDPSSKLCD